ncbi:hypothetical protein KPL70_008660 [Citrus sinensis]|nr:hypothetical protein KPL70_008660 [Citrus sinensis]
MPIALSLQAFFTSIITFISGRLRPSSNPPPSASSTGDDPESQQVTAPVPNTEPKINPNQFLLQWQNVVMAFCFTSAIEIAVLFEQTKSSPLSVSFYLLSFVILIIFLSLFVAKSVGQNFTVTSQVLEKVAIFLAATSFIITITIPFPLLLKCTTWALYALCLIIIVICNKLK